MVFRSFIFLLFIASTFKNAELQLALKGHREHSGF